jgi:hypothetical protein
VKPGLFSGGDFPYPASLILRRAVWHCHLNDQSSSISCQLKGTDFGLNLSNLVVACPCASPGSNPEHMQSLRIANRSQHYLWTRDRLSGFSWGISVPWQLCFFVLVTKMKPVVILAQDSFRTLTLYLIENPDSLRAIIHDSLIACTFPFQ